MMEVLRAAVQGRISMVISGGTGSGKTTMLNALSNFIQPDQFPYTTGVGTTYDCGDYERALDLVLEASGYAGLREEQAVRRAAASGLAAPMLDMIRVPLRHATGSTARMRASSSGS